MGAEIKGVAIADLTDEAFAKSRRRCSGTRWSSSRQKLSHGEHDEFSLRFGPAAEDAYTEGVPGHDNVQPVIKEAGDRSRMVFGSGWHTDSPFLPQPPAITSLRSVEVPPVRWGHDLGERLSPTRVLSETYRQMISGLRGAFLNARRASNFAHGS